MKSFGAILLLSVVASADKDEASWKSYKTNYSKAYSSVQETNRRANFLATNKIIETHNNENKDWKMGHNKFSDYSDSEKKAVLGARPTARDPNTDVSVPITEERALLPSIDYRTDKCLQPARNQGQCGSCWSFAAITPLEFNKCKKTGIPLSLSEQMLIDCYTTGGGCKSGMYDQAWTFLQQKGGAVKSATYPYVSGTTQMPGTTCKFSSTAVGARVFNYTWTLPYGAASASAIMTRMSNGAGPMASAIKITNSFYYYTDGVFSDPACMNIKVTDIDHAIVIVGYGTTKPAGTPYWIVRNSWGTGWGLKGYFLILRGRNMCNIEAWSASVQVI